MTTWVIAGIVALAIVALIARLSRSPGTPAWHDSARSEVLRAVLTGRHLDAAVAPKPPLPMPDFRLPLDWAWRSQAGAAALTDGAGWLIYDTETRGASIAGCNSTRSSSGDNLVARHTVVALKADHLALPRFTLVPNVRRQLDQALPQRFRDAGLSASKVAGWVTKATGALSRLDEHGSAIGFPGSPAFADAFRVVGENEAAVRELFDADVIALLLRHPWAIAEGNGTWLAVSRNTAGAYRARQEHASDGLLSAESAGEVAELASELAGRWSRST